MRGAVAVDNGDMVAFFNADGQKPKRERPDLLAVALMVWGIRRRVVPVFVQGGQLGKKIAGHVAIGGQSNAQTRYVAPTVLTDVSRDSDVMQEEIFGPVLPVVRVENLDAAIRFIRSGDKPLAAYIFTKDTTAESRFLELVSSGSACVNDTMMFMAVHELPFGGVGPSGMGNYSGEYGFRTFSHMKAVMKRGWWPDLDVRYAPFTDRKFRLLRKLL